MAGPAAFRRNAADFESIVGSRMSRRGVSMPHVPTTAGDTDVDDLGVVFMHEHVFIRTEPLHWGWPGFGGWDTETEVATAAAHLRALCEAGVGTILDMTVPGLGRDPRWSHVRPKEAG
jgi:predicted metal-dependent phosphotriesterase family hydrolase